MKKTKFVNKNMFISFLENLGSLFIILPCEDTTFHLTKKYFSNFNVSDRDEIYSDWKQVGDDMRFSLNECQPIIEEHINKTKPQAKVAHQ